MVVELVSIQVSIEDYSDPQNSGVSFDRLRRKTLGEVSGLNLEPFRSMLRKGGYTPLKNIGDPLIAFATSKMHDLYEYDSKGHFETWYNPEDNSWIVVRTLRDVTESSEVMYLLHQKEDELIDEYELHNRD